jgi:hypothetical protein
MYERTYHDKAIKTDKRVLKRERLRRKRRRTLFSILAILVLVGAVFFLRLRAIQVDTVLVKGNEVVDGTDVSNFVLESLQGKYAWVIPRSNILLVSPSKIEQAVAGHFTRIKSVHVARTSPHTLSIEISEYSTAYLWCERADNCYAMDAIGVVYDEAPYYSGAPYPRIYKGPLKPLPFSPLAPSELALLGEETEDLAQLSITPQAYYFDSPRTMRIAFSHNEKLATIYVDPTVPPEESFEKLYTGLRTDPLKSKFESQKETLHYIDLRYEGKVIYKFASGN